MSAKIVHELQALFLEGGTFLYALVGLALAIAFSLMSVWDGVRFAGSPILPSRDWRKLLGHRDLDPEALRKLRQVLDARGGLILLQEAGHRLFARPERHIIFTFVLVTSAPLIGLLGTVSGMFKTFSGMAIARSATSEVISRGISEALITTQAGLIIAVPSFIVCSLLKHRLDLLRVRFDRLTVAAAAAPTSVGHG